MNNKHASRFRRWLAEHQPDAVVMTTDMWAAIVDDVEVVHQVCPPHGVSVGYVLESYGYVEHSSGRHVNTAGVNSYMGTAIKLVEDIASFGEAIDSMAPYGIAVVYCEGNDE